MKSPLRPHNAGRFRLAVPFLAALLIPLLAWLAPAQAIDILSWVPLPTYTLTDLGVLPGDDASTGTAINLLGEAVGVSYNSQGTFVDHAFLYRKGQLIDLGARVSPPGYNSTALSINVKGQVAGSSFPVSIPIITGVGFVYTAGRGVETFMAPGCSYTAASGINSFGQVVGHGYVITIHPPVYSADEQRAFLRQPNGAIANLDIFGSTWAAASTVNDWGQVVGTYLDSHGGNHGFLTQPGGGTPKDLGAGVYDVYAINDLGQVVGDVIVPGGTIHAIRHAFLYDGGKLHDLGTLPGYTYSTAQGINNWGQVVGGAYNLFQGGVPWVYLQEQMRDLNGLLGPAARGWMVTVASGINDLGQIIATATFNNGNPHAVILSPRYW